MIYIYIWIGALSKEIFLPKHPNGKKLVNLIIPPLFLQLTTHCPCWDHDWYRGTRIQLYKRQIPSHPISIPFPLIFAPKSLFAKDAGFRCMYRNPGKRPTNLSRLKHQRLKSSAALSHPKKEHILALHIHYLYCLICFTKLDSGTPK